MATSTDAMRQSQHPERVPGAPKRGHNYPSLPASATCMLRAVIQPMTSFQTSAFPSPSAACCFAALNSSECRCAPASIRVCTWSFKPAAAAKKSGVLPERFRRWTEAPCARKSRRISTFGLVAARCCECRVSNVKTSFWNNVAPDPGT